MDDWALVLDASLQGLELKARMGLVSAALLCFPKETSSKRKRDALAAVANVQFDTDKVGTLRI